MSKAATIMVIVASLIALSCTNEPKAADVTQDLSGKYVCTGKNPEGTAYEGHVLISRKGDHYMLSWTHDGGYGVGFVRDRYLSSSYANKSGASGVVVYEIQNGAGGAKLVGHYIPYPGEGKLYPESLTFSEKLDLK